ncbi:site-specific recombinase XerD [Clostridium aceticum]|uniref:Site-specific recombinase XerD n=1 Tax=Clostridium aceticum TaxID=84022 RepID=A0A0D8IDR4_9CLOT|nr:tyrosine-type recombinase/integrase [Clostridium aceticum]AKL94353.1 site-specific recombinase XerD [Clostridium aceticum]KJF28413.1 integrase [Clostridium aceticum]
MRSNAIPEEKLFFSMTLEFLETYMPRQLGRSPKTIKSYRDSLTIFRRFLLGEKQLSVRRFLFEECTPALIQDFIIYLKKAGNSPGTCNQRLTALRTYLWFATDRDISLQSIALRISKLPQCKTPKKEKETLSDHALKCLLEQPKNTKIGLRDRTMMILLYDSAIRLDELLSLTLQDLMLNTNEPYIRITGKGNKERIVAINTRTTEHLLQYLRIFHPDIIKTSLAFYTKIKGQTGKMSEGNVERFIRQYGKQAKTICEEVPDNVYPHMLRRTRATDLYQNGVELALVSKILGHASIETTKIYATPSMEMMRQALESVETPEQATEKPLWKKCSEEELAKLCGLR